MGANSPAEVEPGFAGQHPVEENEGVRVPLIGFPAFLGRGAFGYVMSTRLNQAAD